MLIDPDDHFDDLDFDSIESQDGVEINRGDLDSSIHDYNQTIFETHSLAELSDVSASYLGDIFQRFEHTTSGNLGSLNIFKMDDLLHQIADRGSYFYSQPEIISNVSPLELEVGVHLSDYLKELAFGAFRDISLSGGASNFYEIKDSISAHNNNIQVMTQKIATLVPAALALYPDRSLDQIIEEQARKLLFPTSNEDLSNNISQTQFIQNDEE